MKPDEALRLLDATIALLLSLPDESKLAVEHRIELITLAQDIADDLLQHCRKTPAHG